MTDESEVSEVCETSNLEFVRLFFVDTSGVIRGRAVSADRIDAVASGQITCPRNILSMDFNDSYVSDGSYGPDGEFRLEPDQETFTTLPYARKAGGVVCNLVAAEGSPLGACARSRFQQFLETVDYDVNSAFESECYLLQTEGDTVSRSQRKPLFSADGIHQYEEFAVRLKEALHNQGIQLKAYYPEGGAGQIEVVTNHGSGVAPPDHQVFKRQTVKAVADATGYKATFAPMVAPDSSPAGMHLNVSLWTGNNNVFYSPDAASDRYPLSEQGRYFIGGILHHASGLCALTAPTMLSYSRMRLHDLAADRAIWGTGDRRCLVRVPLPGEEKPSESTRIEYRLADNTVNPYVALLGVLAAGIDGIRNQIDPGPPRSTNNEAAGKRLPVTLSEALDAFEEDTVLREALGVELAKQYSLVKRHHVQEHAGETTSSNQINKYVQTY